MSRPTIRPYPKFNVDEDCAALNKAFKGLGTDEAAITHIMGKRSCDQRLQIVSHYKVLFGEDLREEFKSELSGNFLECILALCYSRTELDAKQLRDATKGMGTRENVLIEILCSRSNAEIANIKSTYSKMFDGLSLEKEISDDTSGNFRRVLISLLQAKRKQDTTVDYVLAQKHAYELYQAGEKVAGTDESVFNKILMSNSAAHIKAVIDQYAKISEKTLIEALKSEMSGDLLQVYLSIIGYMLNPAKYFASELIKSMKGLGTDDSTLIRIIVSRSEIDLGQIKAEFLKETGKTLEDWIKDDTSGDYCKLLLTICSG